MAGDEDRRGERPRSGRRDPARGMRRDPLTIEGSAEDTTARGGAADAETTGAVTPSPEPTIPEPALTGAAENPAPGDTEMLPPLHDAQQSRPADEPRPSVAPETPYAASVETAADRGRSNFATAMAVAIVVMAGAIIYIIYQVSSLGPDQSAEVAGLKSRLATLEARPGPDTSGLAKQVESAKETASQAQAGVAALTKRVEGLASPPTQPAPPNLQPQVADLQASLADVRKTLAALGTTVAALPRPDLNHIEARFGDVDTRLANLQGAVSGIPHVDLGPLTAKVDALEGRMKPLEAEVQAAQSPERVAERKVAPVAVTAQAVVAAIADGQAFPQQLRALQVLGVEPARLAPLQLVAANGAPSLRELQDDLAQLRDGIVAQGAPAPSGSYMDRIVAGASNLVQVRPLGAVVGDAPAAVVARMNAEIGADDLTAALADWQKLPQASRNASKTLPERIKLRLDAETAARDIAANAIGTLAAPRG